MEINVTEILVTLLALFVTECITYKVKYFWFMYYLQGQIFLV